ERRACRRPIARRERVPRLTEPLEAPPLVRERLLRPGAAVDGALDDAGAAVDRRGVRDEEGRVDAADLPEERAEGRSGVVAAEPAVVDRLQPREVLHEVHPCDDARRLAQRDRAGCRVEAGELRELAVEPEVRGAGPGAHDEAPSAESIVEDSQ